VFDRFAAESEHIGALRQTRLHPIQDRLVLETRDRAEFAAGRQAWRQPAQRKCRSRPEPSSLAAVMEAAAAPSLLDGTVLQTFHWQSQIPTPVLLCLSMALTTADVHVCEIPAHLGLSGMRSSSPVSCREGLTAPVPFANRAIP
jgi:hypothetical protein